MNRLNLLSRLFAHSSRWRRVSVWSALLGTLAGATASAQHAPGTAQLPPDQVFAQAAASDAFVMGQPPSGSIQNQGYGQSYGQGYGPGGGQGYNQSYSREIGVGGAGSFARMGHIVGETVGRGQSITHFEVMPYVFTDNTMWFTDGRFYTTNNGHVGGSGGVGVRQYLPGLNSVIGVSGFYDADGTRVKTFQQAGLSLEYLSEWLDVRTNLYTNVGRKSAVLSTSFLQGSEHFVDDNIAFNTTTRQAAGTDGLDMLFTVPVPGRVAQSVNLEASAGWYHFVPNGFDLDDATGYRLRLDSDLLANVAHTFLEFTSDKTFKNNVIFGADLNYYNDVQRRPRIGQNQFNRMSEWVRRNYNVVAIDQTVVNPDELAINPTTGTPYVVLHVRNRVPNDPAYPNYPAPAGTGSVNTPYQLIAQAQVDPRDADIIYVHSGSIFTNTPVILEANQQLLGEGVNHQIQVANLVSNGGSILMPSATGGKILPILQDTAGTAVTLANNSTIAGFRINDTTGTAIYGENVVGSTIRDVTINNAFGGTARGLDLRNPSGTYRIQNLAMSGVEATDLYLEGGNANITWLGGLIENTSGRAVEILNQTGGIINLAGDNSTNPSTGFGGVTISDNGGMGILINNTAAGVSFGRAAATDNTQAGVVISNSSTTGVQILNLQQAGSVNFLRGLAINDASGIALDIQNSSGNFFLADDTGLTNDLVIMGREGNTAIDLNRINNSSRIYFQGDTVIGGVTDILLAENPAIHFHNESSGTVQFDGDISIGEVNRVGENYGAIGNAIQIGGQDDGSDVNADGAHFIANGNVTAINVIGGSALRIGGGIDINNPLDPFDDVVVYDPTQVTFGTQAAPSQVFLDVTVGDPTLYINHSSGTIRFNSTVRIDTQPGQNVSIENNTGTITMSNLTVDGAVVAADSAVEISENRSVAINTLNIDVTGGTGVRAYNNDSLIIQGGVIDSFGGQAIDFENNDRLSTVFSSVSSTGNVDTTPVIRVVDNQTIGDNDIDIITNPNTYFEVRGGASAQSGGTISGSVLGAYFENINTVRLNGMLFEDNAGPAVVAINAPEVRITNSQFNRNSSVTSPFGNHQVLLRADQRLVDENRYDWTFTNNSFDDGARILTNDAMIQLESTSRANGALLNLVFTDHRNVSTLQPQVIVNRNGGAGAAALRVNWFGPMNATVERNDFELAAGNNNLAGVDIRQRGTGFSNTVSFSQNTLIASGNTDDNLVGVRMEFDGATNLNILNNARVNQTTGAIQPGMEFAGTNATGFELRLKATGNNVVFDDNFLDFNGVGGTGLLFAVINASNVAIGNDAGSFADFGNRIDLTDTDTTFERGIIFQSATGTINLSGNQDNEILLFPNVINGSYNIFQAPNSSTGSIIVNGNQVP